MSELNNNSTKLDNKNDKLISIADVEQTIEDNILCYTHSDRPIDQDPDTECHMAIRTALRMLRKDLRKLPSAQPEEVTPHQNYKYLSDYWCACGWHLGKKGEVKYCADCGRKVNWRE